MKKIAFLIPNMGNGGAERVISILSSVLSDDYYVYILMTDDDLIEYEIDKNVNVQYIPYYQSKNKFIRNLSHILAVRKQLKKLEIDIVISFLISANFLAILASLFSKRRIIVSERSDPYHNCQSLILSHVRNLLYRFSSAIICQSKAAKTYFPLKVQKKIIIIPNPILSDLPIKRNDYFEPIIITAARLHKDKRIDLLIRAFAKVTNECSDIILKIYGKGPQENELKNLVRQLSLCDRVKFMGNHLRWHQESMNAYAYVTSSSFDGMCNSMIEAMATGIPCISTTSLGSAAAEIITNEENGLLIPANDMDALYKAMIKLIDDPNLRIKLSNEGRKIKELLNKDRICQQWIDVINKISNDR